MRTLCILMLFCFGVVACGETVKKKPTTISGVEIYKTRCLTCHGTDGRMGMNGAKALPESALSVEERMGVILGGRKIMPSFRTLLTEEEIRAVAEFTMTLK